MTEIDPLTGFLYLLMRDHLPVGEVKKAVEDAVSGEFAATSPELLALAERYAEPLDDALVADGEGEKDEPVVMQAISVLPDGEIGDTKVESGAFVSADGRMLGQEMCEWIERFDERIRLRPEFVTAVNEAAGDGLRPDVRAAGWVANRVQQLREGAGHGG